MTQGEKAILLGAAFSMLMLGYTGLNLKLGERHDALVKSRGQATMEDLWGEIDPPDEPQPVKLYQAKPKDDSKAHAKPAPKPRIAAPAAKLPRRVEASAQGGSLSGLLMDCGDDPLCIEVRMIQAGYAWKKAKGEKVGKWVEARR